MGSDKSRHDSIDARSAKGGRGSAQNHSSAGQFLTASATPDLTERLGNSGMRQLIACRSPGQHQARDQASSFGHRAELQTVTPLDLGPSLFVQRKCECGATTSGGECTECGKKTPLLQTKLQIDEPGDPFELEADRVAEQVMQMKPPSGRTVPAAWPSAGTHGSHTGPRESALVQRSAQGVPGVAPSIPDEFARRLGPGTPLPPATRAFFEPRFGRDFGNVRVHAGREAAKTAGTINAKAFTAGRSIAFGAGQYDPDSQTGRHLLAHELVHVVQQNGRISRKNGDDESFEMQVPTSDKIEDVKAFFQKTALPYHLNYYFVVKGNTFSVYDAGGALKKAYTTARPGVMQIKGYYIGNAIEVGWGPVAKTKDGQFKALAAPKDFESEIGKATRKGVIYDLFRRELTIADWLSAPDLEDFKLTVDQNMAVGMAVMDIPVYKSTKAPTAVNDGPILSFDLPDWFKQLKTKVENQIAADRKANKANPVLPESITFYGSDKVQAQRGTDAWTIQVNKDSRQAYLTLQKKAWDEAQDKDAYAQQVTQDLYKKVKLIVDETELQKKEKKEITDIDGTGAARKGSKWAWAVVLKKQLEALVAQQKLKEPSAKDFPDKLNLSTQGQDAEAMAYLRVSVYADDKDTKPDALPQLKGGTLPTPLKEGDKAENWLPLVRKAADALRRGAVTTEKTADSGDATEEKSDQPDVTVLPAYPSKIYPRDMNPDRTTATIASNTFRMVIDTAAVHGTNMLNLVTIHMGMSVAYSWKIFRLPEDLAKLKSADDSSSNQLLDQSNEYARKKSGDLGEAKDTYDPDYDWEQSVSMGEIGEGDFLLFSKASIAYPSEWNTKRVPSVAGLPFTVKKAEDLADQSASTDSDALKTLKVQLAQETDDKKKLLLQNQIKDLEEREGGDLLTLTKKDEEETQRLIKKAGELKKFIEDDRKRKLNFSGGKDYDPFMFRLKAFDKDLYSLYILVRQIFDYRYDDLYAIDEYSKIVQQQYDELHKLETRTSHLTDNKKLRQDLPQYRSVAALVKEDDGNLVPLILLVGYHEESKPTENKYKMMVLDVTFDSPKKGDMTYVGGERSNEKDAVKSAFVEFGEDNKYGDGEIVYRVPKQGYKDQVGSVTTATEYLGYALAVIGIVLLIAGTILSAGAIAPASAGAIGMIVTALGISASVAGAALAARNIYKREEKGTFELDAEFALDMIAIIGAAVQVVSTVGKLATLSRTLGAAQRLVQIQRLDRLLLIYNAVEIGGNVVAVGMKVKEDVDAVKALHLSPEKEDEMMQQIAMEAVQQGAMLAFATFSHAKEIVEHVQAKVEASRYKSFQERGWVDEHGKPTENAPPSLREPTAEPGKVPGQAAHAEQAWKETQVLDLAAKPTEDQQHQLTVTENGRIIRCSEACTDLRLQYGKIIGEDPAMESEMMQLEQRAQEAAKSGNKGEAEKVAADAAIFEGKLKQADDLRTHLFGMSDEEIDAALESLESGKVTGGEKSGHKIDDVRIPKRQRRMIDVTDIMTKAEMAIKGGFKKALDRIGKVMGKKISDIAELKKHWDAARADVLKGKEVTDYKREEVIAMYKDAQRKFWENVRKDPAAVEFLKTQGFEFEGDRGAAMATLGPQGLETTSRGSVTNQERRISLDHIEEKAQGENWMKALDADNLELMFQNANSWKEIVQVKFGMRNKPP